MLASAVVRRSPYVHTPPAAREGDAGDIAQLMVYADMLQNALQMYRAHRLWEGLLTKRQRDLSPLQRSYALLRRAQARSQFRNALEKQADLVLKDYDQSRKAARGAPWADQSLMLAGEAAWHLKFDTAAAIALWKTLCEDYPDSGYAPRAAYLTGVVHERAEEWEQAYLAFDKARKKYPNAGVTKLVEDHLRKVTANLAELPTESAPEAVPIRRRTQRSGNAP